jgi:peptide-methionine (S)-S-oxide reductase
MNAKFVDQAFLTLTFILTLCMGLSCANKETSSKSLYMGNLDNEIVQLDTATFGTGCFWCTEAIFQQMEGVVKVTSGYSGGDVEDPTYEMVCEKNTGHAECLQVVFDKSRISYDDLLEIFWQSHDPTTLNKQGNDVGPQYRSVIFYHNNDQQDLAEKYKTELDESGAWEKPIVTAIEPLKKFYPAELSHQNYYKNNPAQPYCYYVIRPKVEKIRKVFKDRVKN